MNLNDDGGGMVSFQPSPPPQQQPPMQKKTHEKNIVKQHIAMDSSPISDVMDGGPDMMMQQDPRMQNMPMMMPQAPMVQTANSTSTSVDKKTNNPFNLTDQQMQAIIAGVCAIIAFSKPVQDKMASTIPQFLAESGSRSNVGLLVTGLIASLIFYFIQKFLNKR